MIFNFVDEGRGSSYSLLNLQGASFSEHFSGQALSYVGIPGNPQYGAEIYEVLSGLPDGPLSLQPSSNDRDNVGVGWWPGDESAMLHGYINSADAYSAHEGAISILFDTDQLGFSIDTLIARGGTLDFDIFARDGSLLSSFTFLGEPTSTILTYAFSSINGLADIAGISIYSTADNPSHYLLDNLKH